MLTKRAQGVSAPRDRGTDLPAGLPTRYAVGMDRRTAIKSIGLGLLALALPIRPTRAKQPPTVVTFRGVPVIKNHSPEPRLLKWQNTYAGTIDMATLEQIRKAMVRTDSRPTARFRETQRPTHYILLRGL